MTIRNFKWCLLMLTTFAIKGYNQESKFPITIHARVDTSDQEVKQIADLWINYLNSTPDSLYNNPYWNQEEKIKYTNFDFSSPYLYQFPSYPLLSYYQPTILSIEKEGEHYGIRTIFSANNLPAEYQSSNPWCITKIYAVKENHEWKLKNSLSIITQNWSKKTIGKITFIYPPTHRFNKQLAKKANLFCNTITREFNFPDWKPFDFYITDSGDELGKLLNFDFFFAGYTTGIGMKENRILLSGMGSEFYPHEFIHLIISQNERHGMIEEGFATWKGGTMQKSFEENARILAKEIEINPSISFWDVLTKKWGWQYAAYYTTGAILCNAAYNKGGIPMVHQLLATPNDDEKLGQVICSIFDINKEFIDEFWRKELAKFR